MSYHINLTDAAGVFRQYGPFDAFEKALGCYRWLRCQWSDKTIHLYNADCCDHDSDGLTDEERERL